MAPLRLLVILGFVLPAACGPSPGADVPGLAVLAADSRVANALVYSQGAVVTRRAALTLPAGRCRIDLRGLPPDIVDGSLGGRLTGLAGARIRLVTLDLIPRAPTEQGEVAAAAAERDRIDLRRRAIDDERTALNQRIELLSGLTLPGTDAGHPTGAPPSSAGLGAWPAVLDFVEREHRAAVERLRALNREAQELDEARKRVEAILTEHDRRELPAVVTAQVLVETPAAGPAELELSYAVRNAAWFSAYTITVDPSNGATDLVRGAWVAQNTGEDWGDTRLTFSSGERHQVAVLPELPIWRIGLAESDDRVEPRSGADDEPGAETIVRPNELAATALMLTNPVAGQAGNALTQAFGRTDGGSLERARAELGGTGAFMAIGAGGGGTGLFGSRTGGGKQRAIGRFGGSAASENGVEASLRWLAGRQAANGSWSSQANQGRSAMDQADSALAILAFLAAGYDHRWANRFRETITSGLAWLAAQLDAGAPTVDLRSRALTVMVLAEAYAMTNDPALQMVAQSALDALARQLAKTSWTSQPGLAGGPWPAHPTNLTLVVMAFKSAKAAGLALPRNVWLQLMALAGELERESAQPLVAAAALTMRVFLGCSLDDPQAEAMAQRLLAHPPTWEGATDLRYLYYATISLFQRGGRDWQRWNNVLRELLISRQIKDGEAAGSWDPTGVECGLGASRVYATAIASLCLECYYRYLPVGGRFTPAVVADSAELGEAGRTSHNVAPATAAGGREWRDRAVQAENVASTGAFRFVVLDRLTFTARLRHVAVPLACHSAFLEAIAPNPHRAPLLTGEARVFLGSDYVGAIILPTCELGAELRIPLGLDRAVRLTRAASSRRREVGFKGQIARTEHQVALTVENGRRGLVEVLLRDRVPRPQDARVRVMDLAFSPAGPDYDDQSDSGAVVFPLTVAPGATAKASIAYAIELPAGLTAVRGSQP